MTTMAFSDQYTAEAPPYEQSEVVRQFYLQSSGWVASQVLSGQIGLLKAIQSIQIQSRAASFGAFANYTLCE